jgi:hypothetical protein
MLFKEGKSSSVFSPTSLMLMGNSWSTGVMEWWSVGLEPITPILQYSIFQPYYGPSAGARVSRFGATPVARLVDIVVSNTYYGLSSSVYGLLIEDIKKVEGPCQSLSLRTDTKGKSDQSAVEQLSPMFGAY